MVESVSFHGTHCPFWLSALHYAQGMWPQAFRYISPAATSWPQRVSRSSARRMLPSDSQRWVEHVGTISWRYVKTNSSEMYKRLKRSKSQEAPYLQNDINRNFISNLWQGFAMGFSCFPWFSHGFPWIPRNGMVPSPSQVPTAHVSRPATCGRPGWRLGFGALRGGDGSFLPLPLRGWEASKRALIWFKKWKMIGGYWWFSLYSEFNLRISSVESILFVRWFMWFIVFCQLSKVLNCWGRNERDAPWNTSHS